MVIANRQVEIKILAKMMSKKTKAWKSSRKIY